MSAQSRKTARAIQSAGSTAITAFTGIVALISFVTLPGLLWRYQRQTKH